MSEPIKPPSRPCGSCPYRKDVPSGVWAQHEYEKLPPYDGQTFEQPIEVFMCHQQDGSVCSGWVGCHGVDDSMAFRIAVSEEMVPPEDIDAWFDFETPVELWASGQEAHDHGVKNLETPDEKAERLMRNLRHKQSRRGSA